MLDGASPMEGWSTQEVLDSPIGRASNDLYGRLHYYVRDLISRLHRWLSASTCSFQLFNVNAAELPDLLDGLTFDRIEVCLIGSRSKSQHGLTRTKVSNITDVCYLGTTLTLYCLAPFFAQ